VRKQHPYSLLIIINAANYMIEQSELVLDLKLNFMRKKSNDLVASSSGHIHTIDAPPSTFCYLR
jgi:hypothetical protein